MEWLLDHEADLVSWRRTTEHLELELITGAGDPLPDSSDPVLLLTASQLKAVPPSLEADLAQLTEEGIWNIGTEPSATGLLVTLEGEGWSLDLSCDALHQSRTNLQPRHYERIIRRQKTLLDRAWSDERILVARLARIKAFVQEQVARANRIAAEATASQSAARFRAQGRLRLAHEVMNIVERSSHAGQQGAEAD